MRWAILAVALLSGCAAPAPLIFGASSSSGGAVALGVFAGLIIISASTSSERGGATSGSRAAPELSKDRKINEVDCTQPIDPSAGNIRCK